MRNTIETKAISLSEVFHFKGTIWVCKDLFCITGSQRYSWLSLSHVQVKDNSAT